MRVHHKPDEEKMLQCTTCLSALQHPVDSDPNPLAVFTNMTNYTEDNQIEARDRVYRLLQRIEFNLRRWKELLKSIPHDAARNVMNHLPPDVVQTSLSPCHPNVTNRIICTFVISRLKQFTTLYNAGQEDMAPSSFGSKTMRKKLLADNLKIGEKSLPKPVGKAVFIAPNNSRQTSIARHLRAAKLSERHR